MMGKNILEIKDKIYLRLRPVFNLLMLGYRVYHPVGVTCDAHLESYRGLFMGRLKFD